LAVIDRRMVKLALKSSAAVALSVSAVALTAYAVGRVLPRGTLLLTVLSPVAVIVFYRLREALATWRRSLDCTKDHTDYMLANGATPFEASIPSLRRAMRSAVYPMLSPVGLLLLALTFVAGLVMGGASPLLAVGMLLTAMLTVFTSVVFICALAIWAHSYFNKNS